MQILRILQFTGGAIRLGCWDVCWTPVQQCFLTKISSRRIVKQVHRRVRGSIYIHCTSFQPAMASAAESEYEGPRSVKEKKHVVVCGAGVIGACTAFFLAQKGVRVTVVEKTGVACASSGKAGGFLALDWSDGSPLGSLSRASFELHAKLAEELDGASYGYRRLETLSMVINENSATKRRFAVSGGKGNKGPSWIDGAVKSVETIGSTKTTAQVHPGLFTEKILSIAVTKHGVELIIGEVQEVKIDSEGDRARVKGVVASGKFIAADSVVIAMGPWSATNSLVSSLTTVSPLKGHSIVLRPKDGDAITPHALFLSYTTMDGKTIEPDIFPRATGEVYISGISELVELPADPEQIKPRKEAISMLQRVAGTVSSRFVDAELTHEQACLRPCSEDSLPIIGKIPNVEGAYVATGHSFWGILNGPATGASLAELIVDGVSQTVNLSAFDPSRFCKTRSARMRNIGSEYEL